MVMKRKMPRIAPTRTPASGLRMLSAAFWLFVGIAAVDIEVVIGANVESDEIDDRLIALVVLKLVKLAEVDRLPVLVVRVPVGAPDVSVDAEPHRDTTTLSKSRNWLAFFDVCVRTTVCAS